MSRQHRRHQRLKLKSLYVWHRYIGLTAALFVLILAVTGLLLNHTERFAFDSRHVHNDWVLDWYGIEAPERYTSYALEGDHITLFGRHLYHNLHELEGEHEGLIGALRVGDLVVVAVDREILLLMGDGELVERLGGSEGVPSGMRRLGLDSDGALVVEGGHAYYQPDADFIRWRHWEGDPDTVTWTQADTLPDKLYEELVEHYRGEVLPVERVLLDLHSGRILGRHGYLVMDIAAVLLIALALSGSLIWLRRRR
ncbi:PepSY domain-containing protein [Thiohalobacter thiocyanaticus]|nr:PepSY domain-containing protein [Thiohalobacter thiocyanaticus]